MANKVLCEVMSDMGGVCINGIQFPNTDDGWKKVVLTDEIEKKFDRPWIDLRCSNIEIWAFDTEDIQKHIFTEKDIGDWSVEIVSASAFNTIYLVKSKGVKNENG